MTLTRHSVMAGLVLAIHVFAPSQDVDARRKAGHDGVIQCSRKDALMCPQYRSKIGWPAHRIRFGRSGDRAQLYFECLYVDVKTKEITAHTFSDDNLVRAGGKWLPRPFTGGEGRDSERCARRAARQGAGPTGGRCLPPATAALRR